MSKRQLSFFQVSLCFFLAFVSGCNINSLPSLSIQPSPTETVHITPTNIPSTSTGAPVIALTETPSVTREFPSTYLPTLPVSSITGDVADQGVREEIINKLATIWLDYFTAKGLPDNVRLQEYQILSAKVYDNPYLQCLPGTHEDEFRADIRFSFKVVDRLYNPWNAGGGNISDDDPLWTIGKTVNPLVFRDGDVYTWVWDWDCANIPFPAPATPTATDMLTPRWVKYEKALADSVIGPGVPLLCEWIILGQQEREVYVWDVCESVEPDGASESTASIIYLSENGEIEDVFSMLVTEDDITHFPADIQKLILKQSKDYDYEKAATDHIALRREHPEIPPMIVEQGVVLP